MKKPEPILTGVKPRMFNSRQRLLARLNQLEKNRDSHQRSVNQYKRDLLVKVYGYQDWMSHLILPAFLCGWTLARMRGAIFKTGVRYLGRFVLLSTVGQAKHWMRQALKSEKQ